MRRGFTIIELLIVIAIILLLSVLLIPSFTGFLQGRKLRAAGSRVETMILRAKSEAIRTRHMHYVVFDKHNSRLALVDSGLDSRSDFDRVEDDGALTFKSGSDDRILPLDADQRSLPEGVYFARLSASDAASSLLFSEEVRCYPDGAIIPAGRPDVPTTVYLSGSTRSSTEVGADIVITLAQPGPEEEVMKFTPPEGSGENDTRRGCFMDINPTTGRMRYEIDTWGRDYN